MLREKEKPFGILIISWIERAVGMAGILIFGVCTIIEFFAELKSPHVGNEDYVGFIFDLILTIITGLILIAGRLLINLNPIGRILNLILAYGLITLFIILFLITGFRADFYQYYKDAFLNISFIVFFIIPFVWAILLVYYFNRPDVKGQFK